MKLSNRFFVIALTVCLIFGLVSSVFAGDLLDISEHWAKNQIESWYKLGLSKGYPDHTFKPDKSITRAEFITLVNKAYSFSNTIEINYPDVSATDWFEKEVAKAKAAGYIKGYDDGTFGPNKPISRQEVAVIISRLDKLSSPENMDVLNKFKDVQDIAEWSKESINCVVEKGYMGGYPDQTFKPTNDITRAESIVTLERILGVSKNIISYDKAGTYGTENGIDNVSGSVIISAKDVTLQNTKITGNLVIAESVGDGNVHLKNVTVTGTTTIKGGGENSIDAEDCTFSDVVTIAKADGKVRFVVSGKTSVENLNMESGAILEEANLTGTGFSNVVVTASGTTVKVTRGTIANLTISETATNTTLDISSDATVTTLNLNAKTKVTGKGSIGVAKISKSATGSSFEKAPKTLNKAEGVEVYIGNTGGGGGGGGGGSPQATVSAVSDINKTTVEVTFNQELSSVQASDFTFTPSLDVISATLKVTDKKVVVLTIGQRTANVDYKLKYKGTDTGFSIKIKEIVITTPVVAGETIPLVTEGKPAEVKFTASVGGENIPVVIEIPAIVGASLTINNVTTVPSEASVPSGALALDIVISGLGDKEVVLTLPIPAALKVPGAEPGAFHWNGSVWEYREATISPDGNITFTTNLTPIVIANKVSKPILQIKNVTQNSVELSWETVVGNPRGFDIYRDGVKLIDMLSGDTRSYKDTGLNAGQEYIYTVVVYNGSKFQSAKADSVKVTTLVTENADFEAWLHDIKSTVALYALLNDNLDVSIGSTTVPTRITITGDTLKSKTLSSLLMSVIDIMTSRGYDNVVIKLQENMEEISIPQSNGTSKNINIYIADKLHGKPHSLAAENYFRNLDEVSFLALKDALKDINCYNTLSATLNEIVSFSTQVYIPAIQAKGLTLETVTITKGTGSAVIETGQTISINEFKADLGITGACTLGSLIDSTITLKFVGTSDTEYEYNFELK